VNPFVSALGRSAIFLAVADLHAHQAPISAPDMPGFRTHDSRKLGGVEWQVIVVILLFLFWGFILPRAVFGQPVFACVNNRKAARLADIRTAVSVAIIATLNNLLSSLATNDAQNIFQDAAVMFGVDFGALQCFAKS
jgi:ribose/xylose/arabinose/galactoside ABC-type transport system permease subunit